MPVSRIQAIIRTVDNIPENFITNSWCIDSDVGPNVSQTEAALTAFYNTMRSTLFSNKVAIGPHMFKWYSLPGLKPNYPFREQTFSLTGAGQGNPLPTEVAMVLSFQGSQASGFPQARRRGRVFIGPLQTSAVHTDGRPTAGAISGLAAAGTALRTAINAGGEDRWCVWSTVDQGAVPVEDGWVDNAFDTQRRRGVATTARTVWP